MPRLNVTPNDTRFQEYRGNSNHAKIHCGNLALIITIPAYAQQNRGGYSQAMSDSAQIDLMEAQTAALKIYTRCLQTASDANKCRPPQPLQMPTQQDQPKNRGGFTQGLLDNAQRNLFAAQTQALKAYSQCLKNNPANGCGSPP